MSLKQHDMVSAFRKPTLRWMHSQTGVLASEILFCNILPSNTLMTRDYYIFEQTAPYKVCALTSRSYNHCLTGRLSKWGQNENEDTGRARPSGSVKGPFSETPDVFPSSFCVVWTSFNVLSMILIACKQLFCIYSFVNLTKEQVFKSRLLAYNY